MRNRAEGGEVDPQRMLKKMMAKPPGSLPFAGRIEAVSKYDKLVVDFFLFKLSYRTYIQTQVVCVLLLAAAGAVLYLAFGDHKNVFLRNAWWVCLIGIPLEVLEAVIAVSRAERRYDERRKRDRRRRDDPDDEY